MRPTKAGSALLGMAITFNPLVSVGVLFRFTDAASAVCLGLVAARAARGRRVLATSAGYTILVVAGILAWIAIDVSRGTEPRLPLRWLGALAIGAVCADAYVRSPESRGWLFLGLAAGAAMGAAVLAAQAAGGIDHFGPLLFHDPDDVTVYIGPNEVRALGLYGHPNASAAVASMAVPAALALNPRKPLRGLAFGLAVAGVASAVSYTRSALVVSALTACSFLLAHRPKALLVGGLAIIALVLFVGPPGGWERWSDPSEMGHNLGGRLDSMAEGFTILVHHPLGAGTEYGASTGRSSTFALHDAFLQAGLYLGVLGPFLVAYPLLRGIGMLRWGEPVSFPCLHLFGLFLFENHLSNVTFVALLFFCCYSVLRVTERPALLPAAPARGVTA